MQGAILPDTGATRNYVSRAFAQRTGVTIEKFEVDKHVSLAGGQKMTVYGKCQLPVQISGWQGHVEAVVMDLDADFDLVLGLNWHKQYKALTHWESMIMEITSEGKQYWLVPYPRRLGSIEGEPDFGCNTISLREAVKAMEYPGTEAVLYFVRSVEQESESQSQSQLEAKSKAKSKAKAKSKSESESESTQETDSLQQEETVHDPNVRSTLHEYKDVFMDKLPNKLPPTRDLVHEIDTGDNAPINIQPYQLAKWAMDEQTGQITDLLNKGLIRESSSAWGSPVLFVRKPDDTWRMCIDYRALNERTRRNTYPLPRIQECIDELGRAIYISKIDLTSGYWQIRIRDADIPKTAFNTRNGKYEFLVMPFGLTNAPATFQTFVNNLFREFLNKFVIVYLDDILIYSNTYEEHVQHIRQVLEILRQNQLYANPRKCVFAKQEVEFCGHIVGNGIVKVMKNKIRSIAEWPQPKNVHEVRQFLGLANYYRRFIKNFSLIAHPLTELLKVGEADKRKNKYRPIPWNTAHQLSFERLKHRLTNAPVLQQVDPSKPFIVETDASDFAIGACLLQLGDDGKLHPVAFHSRKLHDAELRYPVHEKELLAIKDALRTWNYYLENGMEITVLTDHESLKYMNSIRRPSRRLARWIEEFQEWKLKIKYRRGSEAILPDALSRRPDYNQRGSEPKCQMPCREITVEGLKTKRQTPCREITVEGLKTKRQTPCREITVEGLKTKRQTPCREITVEGLKTKRQTPCREITVEGLKTKRQTPCREITVEGLRTKRQTPCREVINGGLLSKCQTPCRRNLITC